MAYALILGMCRKSASRLLRSIPPVKIHRQDLHARDVRCHASLVEGEEKGKSLICLLASWEVKYIQAKTNSLS